MTQFYMLDIIHASDHQLSAGGQWVNDLREKCIVCNEWSDKSEPPEIQIALNHVGRNGFAEFLWNSHALPIFRQDLIDLWRSEGFSGFTVKPVGIIGWHEKPNKPLPKGIPTYWRVFVTSRVKMTYPYFTRICSDCGRFQHDFGIPHTTLQFPKSLSVDETSWDGSDVFGTHASEILCTHRVADATLRTGYGKRIAFVRLENYRRWERFDISKWNAKAYKEYMEGFLIRKPEDL